MNEQKQQFPAGWDEDRIKRVIAHHEESTDEQLAAEDDAAAEDGAGQTIISVPSSLLPAIRQLLATAKSA
jgi:hypothetical protein